MSMERWVRSSRGGAARPSDSDKRMITAACEAFIAGVLKPRFLLEIRPTEFNYPIDISGIWHGNKYRFVQRYRSGRPDAVEPEFDAPFARLEYVGPDRFDLSYMRHTGKWLCLFRSLRLSEALETIEEVPQFQPH